MALSKKVRQALYEKYNGLCGYSGKPLGDDWQVDHINPVVYYRWNLVEGDPNSADNLIPCIRIINHYKRALNLEQWRQYMATLHVRLKKLPKKTSVPRTQKRIAYLMEVAGYFGITVDQPFSGKFYFETLNHLP